MPSEEAIARIRHDLAAYEAERVSAQRAVRWRVPVFLAVLVAVVVALAWVFNGVADRNEQWFSAPHVFLYITGFIASFFVYGWARRPATRLQQSFRDRVMPLAFGFIDGVTYRRGETPESFERLPRETVGTFNRQSFDDIVSGTHDGFAFELYEAKLVNKTGRTSSTMFKGIIVAFDTVASFPGLLVATHKTNAVVGFFRGLLGNRLREVQSGVPVLDAIYEFRTDNVDAALPLVTGNMAKALEWLDEAWPEETSRFALRGNDGFLLIPLSKDFFELPDIAVPLDYETHIRPMIADLAALLATAALMRKIGAPDEVAAR